MVVIKNQPPGTSLVIKEEDEDNRISGIIIKQEEVIKKHKQ